MSALEGCTVVENAVIAQDVWRVVLRAPDVARRLEAGQFVHLRLPALEAHILRRPFSVFAVDRGREHIEVVYQVLGEGTRLLSHLGPGAKLDLIGPLGQGWRVPPSARELLLVAGGVGFAPLNLLIERLVVRSADARVHLVAGAQSVGRLMPLDHLGHCGDRVAVTVATDDGSAGYRGFTTDVARELLEQGSFDYIATCGPEPMQRTVAALAAEHGVTCEVSLERRMACGVGVCLSCVVETVAGSRRACVDGPVFDAREVLW
jgi:dihydroorotate dehydrogenase electron transfer subunit